MSHSDSQPDRFHEVNELLGKHVLHEIDDAQLDRLNDLLLSDAELRRYATNYLEQETALRHHFGLINRVALLHTHSDSTAPSGRSTDTPTGLCVDDPDLLADIDACDLSGPRPRAFRRLPRPLLAAAAMLAIAVSVWIGSGAFHSRLADNRTNPQPVDYSANHPVGNVKDSTRATWSEGSVFKLPDAPIRAGDTLTMLSGLSEIHFHRGATVYLKGPAKLEVLSDMRATLHYGTLTAQVEETAHGFRVDTPNTKVIDLGTEFGLTVNEQGATDMVVFSGKIAMEYAMESAEPVDALEELTDEEAEELASLSAPRGSRLLSEGKALHIASDGNVNRIVSIKGSDYHLPGDNSVDPGSSPPTAHSHVIASVSDNLRDDETSSYYQIVHHGFGEDVRAHVGKCRSEWNGLNAEHGLPRVLRKADYIKTFCDDSVTDHIEITVQLAQAARVYVLFDNRFELPRWLVEGWEDSGYDVGIDEEPSTNRRWWHMIGRGPGVRVDDACSVWFKDIHAPGQVTLGSLVNPNQSLMYGIVAVPLATAQQALPEPTVHHEPKLGLKMIRPDHLPPSQARSLIEIVDTFDQITIATPAEDDAASYAKGMRFRPQTLGGKLTPHRDVTMIDGAMPAMNDGLLSRNNDDLERNAWYNGHGRFSLDLGRPVMIESINCFSWHRTYRNRQYFTVWGSNADKMPSAQFDHDEQAAGWDYIGLAYSRNRKEYNTVHASSLQALDDSMGPYRHLLWVSGSPTFFTEIDVHEAK